MESGDEEFCCGDDYSDEIDNYSDSLEDADEIENYDSLEDYDGFSPREKNFTLLREEDIRRLQEDDILSTSAVLGVSREAAMLLLRHYNWRVNDVQDQWFANEEQVRKAVGLLKNPVVEFSGSGKAFCKICLDEIAVDKSSSVVCGHPFCKECWRDYIRISINDGPGCLMLKCPEPSCGAAVGQDMVDALVSEEEKGKYLSYLVGSYVKENKRIKWCPAPGCDCAVEFVFGSENYDVTCGCSYTFCWNCTEEAHRPVDCETVSKWILKNSAESENMNWMLVNTKPCPNCKRPIEKNQGCMHMTCRMCKHQFCWLCLECWSTHNEKTGGYYACNRYEEQKGEGMISEAERTRKMAKKALDKYTHYYERWASNQSAMTKARAELKQMQDVNLEVLRKKYAQPQAQVVFILEAWKQVIECRRVLKWTYAYGYYVPDQHHIKRFFEYLQGEAETALEKLHHCTEKEVLSFDTEESYTEESYPTMSFNEFRTKLVNLTGVTKNYFQNLVKEMENGLADVHPTR